MGRFLPYYYFPLAIPFVVLLAVFLAFVFFLIQIGILGYAYEKMGLAPGTVFLLLILSLLGSSVNLPVAELPSGEIPAEREVSFLGVRYVIPVLAGAPRTIVAVNLGGALVPAFLSLYLLSRTGLFLRSALGVALVAGFARMIARPVRGVGIVMPVLMTPIVAAIVAVLLAPQQAPPLAYISGTLGTLIGADLLNLHRLRNFGAPIVSVGGAGTFDGVFLTGILAVLLA